MFKQLLIANRGEIACRIIRTARRMGLKTIAIYSSADAQSLHVKQADEAWCVGGPASLDSYLNQSRILDIAHQAKADAIHPGYGFLSEHPEFAARCRAQGFIFIGPSARAMEIMGSKQASKILLQQTAVPLMPGYHEEDQSDEALFEAARAIGYPILLKAAFGGGGKGMRAVFNEAEFLAALHAARRESLAYFDHDTMIIEKLMKNPRHIEVQIMADQHGHVVHLFDRDCSIQRRHQKIIEEAPAPDLPDDTRQALYRSAIDVAQAIEYEGAGTIEFLYLPKDNLYYFMEMNTRLQVEHPVTESITGIDLVEWQCLIAAGAPLPLTQTEITAIGHAVECRLYAEDPAQAFIPSTGQISHLTFPSGDGIRIDQGVEAGDILSPYYDSMIAKLITHGKTRTHALQKMQQLLSETTLWGIQSNLSFLHTILNHTAFMTGGVSTHFLEDNPCLPIHPPTQDPLIFCAIACYDLLSTQPQANLLQQTYGWHPYGQQSFIVQYEIDHQLITLQIEPQKIGTYHILFKQTLYQCSCVQQGSFIYLNNQQQSVKYHVINTSDGFILFDQGIAHSVKKDVYDQTAHQAVQQNQDLKAPMASTIIAYLKTEGDMIKQGEPVIILEAMKMEHTLHAPYDGQLKTFFYPIGTQVQSGQDLLLIEPSCQIPSP